MILSRVFNAALLIAILVGAVLAIRAGLEQHDLRAEYRRLQRLVGELPIVDQDKIQVVAIETADPLYFVWRAYLPAGPEYQWSTESAGGGSSWGRQSSSSEPEQGFIRVRLRRRDDGGFDMFTSRPGGSSLTGSAFPGVGELLTDPASQLRFEQLGRDGPVAISPVEVATLLQIELRPEFREQIRDQVRPAVAKRLDQPLMTQRVGAVEAFEREENRQSSP